MGDVFQSLEAEYCPPLDTALLLAILNEYDLNDKEQVATARGILDPLKENAEVEEAASIGQYAPQTPETKSFGAERVGSGHDETSASSSRETDLTTLSNGLSSVDLEHENASLAAAFHDVEYLDKETRVQLLAEHFPGRFNDSHIEYVLHKCGDNWYTAFDELLNHVYLQDAQSQEGEDKISTRGIDAFSEENVNPYKAQKGRSRKKASRSRFAENSTSSPSSPTMSSLPPVNKWQTSGEDIDFLSKRISMSKSAISSIYHQNGASLGRTIEALLGDPSLHATQQSIQNPVITDNADELGNEFPSISLERCTALICITHPSTAAAHELAKALTARSGYGGVEIIPHYEPPKEIDTGLTSHSLDRPGAPSTSIGSLVSTDPGQAGIYAAKHNAYRSQASAAYRKAKSDHLMGGAATYYGQQSREYAALAQNALAIEMNALAEAQSDPSQLDLHGVDVLNAVRIAREHVERWWSNRGEGRLTEYEIVVGRGTHSDGGRSKLGPAVSKMLRGEGWKMESQGAVIVVKGRMKR